MSETIRVSLDNQGRIVIPSTVRKRLGLSQGMTLVVEKGEKDELYLRVQTQLPKMVDKQGVLVVQVEPSVDLGNITQQERRRRLYTLVQRVGL
jgi:AbrB family looped-hinge helix DNA binding protein